MCALPNMDAAKVFAGDPLHTGGGIVDTPGAKERRASNLAQYFAYQEVAKHNPLTPLKIIKAFKDKKKDKPNV